MHKRIKRLGKERSRLEYPTNGANNDADSGSTSRRSCETPNIPGFYYDPEKKRYYRILPGHGNVMCAALNAKIAAAENRQKQSALLPAFDAVKQQRTDTAPTSFVSHFRNMQIGQTGVCSRRSQILSGIIQNLTWHNMVPVLPVLPYDLERNNCPCLAHMFCTTDENQLICQWNLQSPFDCLIGMTSNVMQRLEITDAPKASTGCTTLQCLPVGYQHSLHSTNEFQQIMSACIAHTDMLDCHVTPVLYCAAVQGLRLKFGAMAVLDPLDSNSFDQPPMSERVRTFSLGQKWVWSCAWSPGLKNRFAIGTERMAFLFDANTGKRFALNTRSSDVLSQVFSSPSSNLLYAGTRSGAIYCYESQTRVTSFQQKSSVYALCVTSDDRQLIAADFSGKLVSWDTRQRKLLTEYPEHVNSSSAGISVGIDQNNHFVYAVGSDRSTRIWSLQTGELLKTLASPYQLSSNNYPTVCVSESFGRTALPGMIMGIKNELHYYSL